VACLLSCAWPGIGGGQAPREAPGFPYDPMDVQRIDGTVDCVVWNGLTRGGDVEVVFLEIKTGGADLNPPQPRIRRAVREARVRFDIFRPQLAGELEDEVLEGEILADAVPADDVQDVTVVADPEIVFPAGKPAAPGASRKAARVRIRESRPDGLSLPGALVSGSFKRRWWRRSRTRQRG
jgi:Endonuclease related to archaeal Holliday junction resolvase